MTMLSAVTITPGLKDASVIEKAQCSGEKVKNNLKNGLIATGIGVAAGGASALAIKYQPVADMFAKGADVISKGAKKAGVSKLLGDALGAAAEFAYKNPKTAKALAVIGGITTLAASALQIKTIYDNAKTEGKYQAVADAKK